MNLKEFISKMPVLERGAFAKKCGTSKGHLQNVMYGTSSLAPRVCVSIERESGGVVTRKDLHPEDWFEIWPELAQAPANQTQAAINSVVSET